MLNLLVISKVFTSKVVISKVFVSIVFISKVFISIVVVSFLQVKPLTDVWKYMIGEKDLNKSMDKFISLINVFLKRMIVSFSSWREGSTEPSIPSRDHFATTGVRGVPGAIVYNFLHP
jgi:hypothetical protein